MESPVTAGLSRRASSQMDQPRLSEDQLTALLDLSRALASELDVDALLGAVLAHATELLDADRSTLFLIDPDQDQLWSRIAHGMANGQIRIPRTAGIAGHVAQTGQVV